MTAEVRAAARVAGLPANFWGAMDREIARLAAEPGPAMIDVSKGNPDLPTPEHIVAAMQAAVADPRNHGYPSYAPRPALRRAVALRYREDHGVDLDPDTEVAVAHGSHEAILGAVMAFADPGTAVVAPDPGYPLYTSAAHLAGAHVVPLPLAPPAYQPDLTAALPAAASVVLLNYPHNPTGALATAQTFADAADYAARAGAVIVHDFAYASLGFDGRRPLSALAVPAARERTIEAQTLSKTYSMAGWRIGFAAGRADLVAALTRYQAHAFSTVAGATQDAAAAALSGDQTAARDLVALYQRRRDVVVAGLRRAAWDVSVPEGSFFVWARVPGDVDASETARRLREEARVAVAPGDGFGPGGRGHIRIGLVRDEHVLVELVERLVAFTRR